MAQAMISHGFMIHITIKTDIDLNPPEVKITNKSGIYVSKTDKSFVNLVTILPIGLESKNCIFALKSF
jgi:hypothetical protein